MEYPFTEIEKKWQKIWDEQELFKAQDKSRKQPYYVLSMFPYPSGALHMGHVSNYTIGDAIARIKMAEGYNVLQPMGYDAFGMPAENYAIKHNSHPKITTEQNIKLMKQQLSLLGLAVDWSRELSTSRPDYYKWGQWLFKRLYENGLVYRKSSFVNWCDECQTVLANEQVDDGKCWRCDSQVHQKELEQWFFKITKYAEELLDFSKMIDWPDRVIAMQKHWMEKSEGSQICFQLENTDKCIKVFTTRPDTVFGVTFMALPPEHPLVAEWLSKEDKDSELALFCKKVINEDKITRGAVDTTKEGIFTGRYCINPLNGDKIQIWVTNYVLMEYGTGAVMAVPAHDQRDFEFAKKYDIPIKIVIQNPDKSLILEEMSEAYIDEGILVNSGQFDDMPNNDSKVQITQLLIDKELGEKTVNYRLRDWGISRQRYWGNPIPVVYCKSCGIVLVPDEDLPVVLPDNVQIGKTTKNPLLSVEDWLNTTCPNCKGPAVRESDTMDTFVDSSWYFARFTDPKNDKEPFDKKIANHWLPVDQYIGGIEHACMHLLYARFFHKFMRDIGLLKSDEPFLRLLTQGMVTKDGHKMSKSKGNAVDPQEYIDRYGADTVRLFVLFASPPEKDVEWSDDGVMGSFRFLNRLWRYFDTNKAFIKANLLKYPYNSILRPEVKCLRYSTHFTTQKVVDDMKQRMQFNTDIAAIMEHFNNLSAFKDLSILNDDEKKVVAEAASIIPRLLYPFAPHLAEELWSMIGQICLVHVDGLPEYNPKYLIKDEITYAVQVQGKVRGTITVSADLDEEAVKKLALDVPNVQKVIGDKEVVKMIVVPKKLVSIVIK
ncbi:MAG: leucine--tRNA ligase [Candidatus Cloacimonetes bacterium]|nr:leucine--tRNA ligase [Candidatus Cloacimonadota bacterium]